MIVDRISHISGKTKEPLLNLLLCVKTLYIDSVGGCLSPDGKRSVALKST